MQLQIQQMESHSTMFRSNFAESYPKFPAIIIFIMFPAVFLGIPPQPPSQQPPPISTGPVLPRLVIPRPGTSGGGDQPPGLVVVGAVEAQLPIGGRLKQYNFIILIIWIINMVLHDNMVIKCGL